MPAPTPRRTRRLHLIPALVLAGLLTACTASDEPSASDLVEGTEVVIVDNDFEPAALQVEVGQTVTWVWEGDGEHNVVGDDFESTLQSSGTFTHTFDEPGTYDYTCQPHGGMDGQVVVVQP